MENVSDLVNEHPFDRSLQAMFLKHTKETCGIDEANRMRALSHQFVDFSDNQWIEWIIDSREREVEMLVDVISKALTHHPSPKVLAACVDCLSIVVASGWNQWKVLTPRPTAEKSAIRYMEQALDRVSLWPESGVLWDAARTFLTSLKTEKESVRKMYVRQLQAVPMKAETVAELKAELSQYEHSASLDPLLSVDTSKSEKIWRSWSSLESRVHEDNALWEEMIQKRAPIDPPEYVSSLLERAVIYDSENEKHWINLADRTRDDKLKITCLERGVKNCPNSGRLWTSLIQNAPLEQAEERFLLLGISALRDSLHVEGNDAFLSELLLYEAQIKIRLGKSPYESFQSAISILSEVSPALSVGALIFWLHSETFVKQGDDDNSIGPDLILSEFLSSEDWVDKRNACIPLQWVQLAWIARQAGNLELCRKIFAQAVEVLDDKFKNVVLQDWILFERTFGTLQQVADLNSKKVVDAKNVLVTVKESKRKIPHVSPDDPKKIKTDTVPPPADTPFPNCVFIKDLPFSANEDTLSNFLETDCQIAKPHNVLIVKNSLGKSRGFGYAEFDHPHQAQTAILCSGKLMDGRPLYISASTRAITVKKDHHPSQPAPQQLEQEKDKTNDYFRNLILQKKKHSGR